MSMAVITGAAGLVGSSSVSRFHAEGLDVVGIDNDTRKALFGPGASTCNMVATLEQLHPGYRHQTIDIRDRESIMALFKTHGRAISVVVHAAAQPSHDWAAQDPQTDFAINAQGTLNLLEACRAYCPDAVFIHCSTNKVYGDRPNHLPLIESELRWHVDPKHPYATRGIPEDFGIDQCKHSLFGVSKAAADLMVQEYGRYFGLSSACFRAGCITGPDHRGTCLHGFLAYLGHCVAVKRPYTVFGYQGKQVRDNIHASDLADAFWQFFLRPRVGEVYNIGGGPSRSCSVVEAIDLFQDRLGRQLEWSLDPRSRSGDHVWWISDCAKFEIHYPEWRQRHSLMDIVAEISEANR